MYVPEIVWREPLFILRICELYSTVIVRFEILLWLYAPEKVSRASEKLAPGLSV